MERQTRQRNAIRGVIADAGRPLTPLEIYESAGREVEGIGMATVYRSIKGLLAAKEIVAVDMPGEPPRYESSGKGHHHHFACRDCGKMYEVDGCPGDLAKWIHLPEGFRVDAHELILYGHCNLCGTRTSRSRKKTSPSRRNRAHR